MSAVLNPFFKDGFDFRGEKVIFGEADRPFPGLEASIEIEQRPQAGLVLFPAFLDLVDLEVGGQPEEVPGLVLNPAVLTRELEADLLGFLQVPGGYQAARQGLQG
jgi:hypothetical protein